MKINCLFCGHNIDLDDAYADHYDGDIKCFGCSAVLEIRTEQGTIRGVRLRSGPGDAGEERHRQALPEEAAKGGKAPAFKVRSKAKHGAVALNDSGVQHASPANSHAA